MSASLLISACTGNPTGPSVRLNEAFVLEPGETALLQGRSVQIRFVRVTGDSRCPIDVVCVLGGDAIVEISVRSDRDAVILGVARQGSGDLRGLLPEYRNTTDGWRRRYCQQKRIDIR